VSVTDGAFETVKLASNRDAEQQMQNVQPAEDQSIILEVKKRAKLPRSRKRK
jgi:hypothetical protein